MNEWDAEWEDEWYKEFVKECELDLEKKGVECEVDLEKKVEVECEVDLDKEFDNTSKNVPKQGKPLYMNDFKKANGLVLSSGGIKGIYIIGAIQYLYEKVGLDHIKSYYGTSIGSIICGLLIIGFTPLEILVCICIKKIINYLLQSFTITNLIKEKRLLESSVFLDILKEVIINKIGYIPTLGELYHNFNKKLCVVTISREDVHKPLYLSSDSHPDLSMVHALHMSSSIPYVFGYATYDNIDYFDGAILDSFPILYASKREEWVFGIDITCEYIKSKNIIEDIMSIINIPINCITDIYKNQVTNGVYINIMTQNEVYTKDTFSLLNIFISGYRQCKEKFIKEKNE
jgi:predicted acylesterase/phospholipase RssA